MKLFHRKDQSAVPAPRYDRDRLKPVIRSSICTGEKVACFKNLETGRLEEVMLIRGESDLEAFRARYGITEPIETIY